MVKHLQLAKNLRKPQKFSPLNDLMYMVEDTNAMSDSKN